MKRMEVQEVGSKDPEYNGRIYHTIGKRAAGMTLSIAKSILIRKKPKGVEKEDLEKIKIGTSKNELKRFTKSGFSARKSEASKAEKLMYKSFQKALKHLAKDYKVRKYKIEEWINNGRDFGKLSNIEDVARMKEVERKKIKSISKKKRQKATIAFDRLSKAETEINNDKNEKEESRDQMADNFVNKNWGKALRLLEITDPTEHEASKPQAQKLIESLQYNAQFYERTKSTVIAQKARRLAARLSNRFFEKKKAEEIAAKVQEPYAPDWENFLAESIGNKKVHEKVVQKKVFDRFMKSQGLKGVKAIVNTMSLKKWRQNNRTLLKKMRIYPLSDLEGKKYIKEIQKALLKKNSNALPIFGADGKIGTETVKALEKA
jgi:hypothetical protein